MSLKSKGSKYLGDLEEEKEVGSDVTILYSQKNKKYMK